MIFIQKTIRVIRTVIWMLPLFLFLGAHRAGASCNGLCNPLAGGGINSIETFVEKFLQAVMYIGFPLAALFIVYAGFRFVFAQGNTEEITKAKQNFMWGVVGIALLLGATALAAIIKATVEQLR